MKLKNNDAPTTFLNVEVTAIPKLDSKGKVTYETTFNPEKLVVKDADVVINYQLVSPTPDAVIITKMTVKPDPNDQFSAPSISKNGKMVTFSDANTTKEKLFVKLHFKDKDNVEFAVDPEVENEPRPKAEDQPLPSPMVCLEPEVENEPRPK
jgi:hypothetical protein